MVFFFFHFFPSCFYSVSLFCFLVDYLTIFYDSILVTYSVSKYIFLCLFIVVLNVFLYMVFIVVALSIMIYRMVYHNLLVWKAECSSHPTLQRYPCSNP